MWILGIVHVPRDEFPLFFFQRGPAGTVVGDGVVLALLTVARPRVFFIDLTYGLTKAVFILRDFCYLSRYRIDHVQEHVQKLKGEEGGRCIVNILLTALPVWEAGPALCCSLHLERGCESTRYLYSRALLNLKDMSLRRTTRVKG